jgi:hypothetical protein
MDYANHIALEMADKPPEEYIGRRLSELFSKGAQARFLDIYREVLESRKPVSIDGCYYEDLIGVYRAGVWLDIRISPLDDAVAIAWRNVTERKRSEDERETVVWFLRLMNESMRKQELIHSSLLFFQEVSGCEAVGIRLRDGEDYPYFEVRGFSHQFVQVENCLCARDANGLALRDEGANPVIDCMCGNVVETLRSVEAVLPRTEASGPTPPPSSSPAPPRRTSGTHALGRCNGEGYESVALIPLQAECAQWVFSVE